MTEGLVGKRGTLTIGCRGTDGPGEVVVEVNGCSEAFMAYSPDRIPRGASVVIYDDRGGRKVEVEALSGPVN